jgi:poly-gamma-glutamate synthesis protein (capsule biosynthesis protein)
VPVGLGSGIDQTSIARLDNEKVKVSVVAVNTLNTFDSIEKSIKSEKENGAKVIIFPHWGTEYSSANTEKQRTLAHNWIDAGADLIIGSHPHVMENAELYKNKPIFYSLGNFIFDQNFSKETQRGLILAGSFSGDKINLVLLPTAIVNFQPELLRGGEKTKIIGDFRRELGLPDCLDEFECAKISI